MVNNGFEAAAFSPYCHFAAFSGRKRLVPAGASARRTVAELQKTLYRIFGRCSQRVLCGQLGFELHPPASSPAPSPSPVHAKHCTGKGKAGGLRPLNTGIYCYYPLLPRCGISPKGKACPRLG